MEECLYLLSFLLCSHYFFTFWHVFLTFVCCFGLINKWFIVDQFIKVFDFYWWHVILILIFRSIFFSRYCSLNPCFKFYKDFMLLLIDKVTNRSCSAVLVIRKSAVMLLCSINTHSFLFLINHLLQSIFWSETLIQLHQH